jgi:hypothetical protein
MTEQLQPCWLVTFYRRAAETPETLTVTANDAMDALDKAYHRLDSWFHSDDRYHILGLRVPIDRRGYRLESVEMVE